MKTRIDINIVHASKDVVQAIVEVYEQYGIQNPTLMFDPFLATVQNNEEGFSALKTTIAPLDDDTKQKILLYLNGYRNALNRQKKKFFWF